jgi:hypothetical protein
MDPTSFNSAAAAVKECIKLYKEKIDGIDNEKMSINKIEKCVDDILKINCENVIRVQNYVSHKKLKTGSIKELFSEEEKTTGRGLIIYTPATSEYIKTTNINHISNIAQYARNEEDTDPNKCVRIQFVFQTSEPICMSFTYEGDNIKELRELVNELYGMGNVTFVDTSIMIKEMSDNYREYVGKYLLLMKNPKLAKFKNYISKLEVEYPEGVDFDIVKIPVDPIDLCFSDNQPIVNIYFNITDNRVTNNNTYINSIIHNNTGNIITIHDVSSITSIDEKNIDVEYLKYLSLNPPGKEEHKRKYHNRMKEESPLFQGKLTLHNKYMDALGWCNGRVNTGHYIWVKKPI